MRKLIYSRSANDKRPVNKGFSFWPTIVLEAHPSEHRWHLIWWECYEIDRGKKWLIELPKRDNRKVDIDYLKNHVNHDGAF